MDLDKFASVIVGILDERQKSLLKFSASKVSGCSAKIFANTAKYWQAVNDLENQPSWATVLLEEVFEAVAEEDDAKLRAELEQVASVAIGWIMDLDSRVKTTDTK